MAWFSVRILFEIKHKRKMPIKNVLFSDSIFIVKARNEDSAVKKAMKHAHTNEETTYQNYRGETVTWKIKKLMDVKEILDKEIKEFTEIYSCFYRGWYPKTVKNKK